MNQLSDAEIEKVLKEIEVYCEEQGVVLPIINLDEDIDVQNPYITSPTGAGCGN